MLSDLQKLNPGITSYEALGGSTFVSKVRINSDSFILKSGNPNSYFARKHLANELLFLSEYPDLDGITHLLETYDPTNQQYEPMLKEWFEGKRYERDIASPEAKLALRGVVERIHGGGFAKLELVPKNAIYNTTLDEFRLIDFGLAKPYGALFRGFTFFKKRDADLRALDKLLA